jgi:hypothetical protein
VSDLKKKKKKKKKKKRTVKSAQPNELLSCLEES